MRKTLDTRGKVGQVGWLWTVAAILPLALVGCQPKQPVQSQANTPEERVAGERQEQGDSETMRVVQEASLPSSFAFGGRTWKAHQVHWVKPEAATTPNTPGTTSTDAAPGSPGTPEPSATGGDNDNGMGGFVRVGTFSVAGHQIFRRSDADEAVTDNIYIQAENVRPPANGADGTLGTSDGAANGPDGTATEGTVTTDTSTRIAFVEYDADENLVENVELSRLLEVTGLPATVQHGGKTWKADEIQVFDPDVFDDLTLAPQKVGGQTAFVGDDKDHLWLEGELDPTMMKATAGAEAGTTNDTASQEATPGTSTDPALAAKGPIFIEYEVQ